MLFDLIYLVSKLAYVGMFRYTGGPALLIHPPPERNLFPNTGRGHSVHSGVSCPVYYHVQHMERCHLCKRWTHVRVSFIDCLRLQSAALRGFFLCVTLQ